MEEFENEIIEINSDKKDEDVEITKDEEIVDIENNKTEDVEEIEENTNDNVDKKKKKKEKKPKRSLKERWNGLTKKKKIIIIVVSVIVLLLIIGIILFFTLFNKKEVKQEKPVIFEAENYRYENGNLIFLDKNDKKLGKYSCKEKNEKKCMVAKIDLSTDTFERVLSIDENNNELVKSSLIYLDNYVFVLDGKELFLYNIKEKEKDLKVKSFKAYSTMDNVVVVEDEDGKFGLIEIKEEGHNYLIRPSYDNLGIINPTLVYILATDKDEHYIIDKEGKKLSKTINEDIQSVNQKYIVAKSNNSYDLFDYENNELLKDYDYIGLNDSVIYLVTKNKLYLRDQELNKLHEEGIKLNNNDYIKKYIYDKENKLVDTKKAFDISINEGAAIVTVGETNNTINLYEGIVSKNYSYVNYFDGKLYFYGDEDKADLIGTYTCKNKNILKSKNDKLTLCKVHETDKGVTGIYNNDYVFIYDNMASATQEYYLYSLKKRNVASSYNSLEIVNKEELGEKTKLIYTSESYFIVNINSGSNKGNFGVHEITSEKVSGKVPFKYKSLTENNGYYIGVDTNGKYSIYDNKFKLLVEDVDFIKTHGTYFSVVKDKKLNIYNNDKKIVLRSGPGENYTEYEVNVNDNNYDIIINDTITIKISDTDIKKFTLNGYPAL